jgi:hypothetical protein
VCANLNRLVTVQLVRASPILCGFSRCGSFEPRGRWMTVMRRYSNYTMCFLAFLAYYRRWMQRSRQGRQPRHNSTYRNFRSPS